LKFFLIDFEKNKFILENMDGDFLIDFNGIKNFNNSKKVEKKTILKKTPICFDRYKEAFNNVISEIKNGNTYLLNLTFPTKIETNLSLDEIFYKAKAKFKLKYKNFVCFSPERFVKIENNKIYTYPMKGTIDANIPNAKEKILNNQKELAEHTMVVDLLRNDLGMVAKNIRVNKFRYIDKIKAGDKELFQVSSEIIGNMENNWIKNWQEIIMKLLPAGSITGTPKKKTIEIIKNIENYERGFYTGVFGVIDEKKGFLDSAVIIRYVENQNGNLIYKSGGGITLDSKLDSEYQELIDKVYLPLQ